MEPERLDDKLLIRKCPNGFARFKTRPPLLSSATRLHRAKLAGANARPPYGIISLSFLFIYSRIHSSIPGPGSRNTLTALGAHFTVSPW